MNEESIFDAALGKSDLGDRAAFLDQACQGRPAMRERVEGLLVAYPQGEFLESPASLGDATISVTTSIEKPSAQIGPYKLLEQIGEGGMGVVYLAAQDKPVRRKVALKVIKPGMDSRQVVARFEAERQALAMMDHPNIARILDAGTTEAGLPFFAMEHVEGLVLTEFCDQHQLDLAERLKLFVQICQAVQHAHQKGVIHRDLKPSNILVGRTETTSVPKVIDFGVAKALMQPLTERTLHTDSVQMLGTPLYMSPEQAYQNGLDVDTRTDVYSLGVVLYELLTGTTPFGQEILKQVGMDEMRRMICEEQPPCPSHRISTLDNKMASTVTDRRRTVMRRLSMAVRRELDWIVMKALEKDRNRRYESASALAADVQRYLDDQPVQACPPSTLYAVQKFVRRQRHLVAMAGVILVLILASLKLLWNERSYTLAALSGEREQRQLAEEQRQNARQSEALAVARRNDALTNQYYAEIVSGEDDWRRVYLQRLDRKLMGHLPLPGQTDRRGWEWYYLWSLGHPEVRTLAAVGNSKFAAWSPDGEMIGASGSLWQAKTARALHRFDPSGILRYRGAWSPDSRHFAWGMASDDDGIYVWDRADDNLREFRGHASSVWSVGWSPDSRWLASGSIDRTVKVWDATNGEIVHDFTTPEKVACVAWSPDGNLLAACTSASDSEDTVILVWNWQTNEKVADITVGDLGDFEHSQLSWHPEGHQIALSTSTSWLLIQRSNWTVTQKRDLPSRGGRAIAWSPDGDRLAIADGTILQIWLPSQEEPEVTLNGHLSPIFSVAWSPNGKHLVTADESAEIKMWDLTSRSPSMSFFTDTVPDSLTWLPDNRSMAIVDRQDGSVSMWDAELSERAGGQSLAIEPKVRLGNLMWSPQRRFVACYDDETASEIRVLDAQSGQIHANWKGAPGDRINAIAWSNSEQMLAIARRSEQEMAVVLWDLESEREILRWKYEGPERAVAGSLGRTAVPAWWDGLVRLSWSPNDANLAIAAQGQRGDNGTPIWQGHVYVVSASTGQTLRKHNVGGWRHRAIVSSLTWHPEGRDFLAGTSLGVIEAVNVESGTVQFSTRLQTACIHSLAWSPDGLRIATASEDRTVKVLSSSRGEDLLALDCTDEPIEVSWSPNGRRLAAVSASGLVNVWDASKGYEFTHGAARRGELALAYYQQFSQVGPEEREACLREVLRLAPDRLDYWSTRGHARANLGDFEGAADEFAKLIASGLRTNFGAGINYGHALLATGQFDAYRAHVTAMMDEFSDSPVKSNSQKVAWLASLTPTTDSYSVIPVGIEKLLSYPSSSPIAGAVLYRLGRFQEAADRLTQFTDATGSSGDLGSLPALAQGLSLLAMARHQLGNAGAARRILEESIQLSERIDFGGNWDSRVECRTLENEARDLIHD